MRAACGTAYMVLTCALASCQDRALPPTTPTPTAPMTVTGIVPKSGWLGTGVQISGTGFSPQAILTLGAAAPIQRRHSSTIIVASSPPHPGGTVDVVVTNPNGDSAVLAEGFTHEIVVLTASATLVAPGGRISVGWVAPSGRSPWDMDWIGFGKVGEYPSVIRETGWWLHTNGAATGSWTFEAPTQPGEYEFLYLPYDEYWAVARSTPVTVR